MKSVSGFVLAGLALCWSMCGLAHPPVHFLIPGGAGGGWDSTARAVGRALQASGLVERVSFENLSGAGGGRAMSHLLEQGRRAEDTLMVNSTPVIVRSLMPMYELSWRDFTPIAAVIGDYGAIAVRSDSPFADFEALHAALRANPRAVKFAGGSTRGGLDHLLLASVFMRLGLDPLDARYVPYDAGGKAALALLSGEVGALSSSVGDTIVFARDGRLRVLAIAAPRRVAEMPDVPIFAELGYPVEFVNWRGFFAIPGLPEARRRAYETLLAEMMTTPAWQAERSRNGWIDNFVAGDAFVTYLERQEREVGSLMRALGFIR